LDTWWKDGNNYYVARANALENNVSLYYTVADLRKTIKYVNAPVISKIRHRRLPVGASLLIRMHEVSDLSIRELRNLMGDRREKFRISDKQFKPKNKGEEGTLTEEDMQDE
jgi:2-methylcitrate dehydratase PrpD